MDAIDQFLDDSIVLPPGDWDQDLILPLMHERNEKKLKKGEVLKKKLHNLIFSKKEKTRRYFTPMQSSFPVDHVVV